MMPNTCCSLCCVVQAKQVILSTGILGTEGPATAAGASLCSGFVAALVSTPADVVKSRVMSQVCEQCVTNM
jgi:solute carrier family 25 uncoupling protein 27